MAAYVPTLADMCHPDFALLSPLNVELSGSNWVGTDFGPGGEPAPSCCSWTADEDCRSQPAFRLSERLTFR